MWDNKTALLLIKAALFVCCFEVAFGQKDGAYYKHLWNENVQKLREWQQPVDNEEFKHYTTTDCKSFGSHDYIIIGAGSTGSVLANRLSKKPKLCSTPSVLLLEAGGDETEFSKIPATFPAMLNSDMNWGYLTVPQKYACFGNIDRRCTFARGKVSGGGSSVNGMVHVRGNRLDWQMKTWTYKDVLPYFKKSENATAVVHNSFYRGYKGPLKLSYPTPPPPLLDAIIEANKEEGYQMLDYNGKQQIGVSKIESNTYFGRRWSTNEGYLKPVLHRKNLKVLNKALATKIGFRGDIAVNVTFLYAGACYVAKAKKEIIVSAGAVNSPQLLMLSGVGPKEELAKFNIPLVKDLPVGQNLMDHAGLYNVPFFTNQNISANIDAAFEDYSRGVGWLTYTSGLELSFVQVGNNSIKDYPDVEVIYMIPKRDFNVGDLNSRTNNYNQATKNFISSTKPTTFFMHFMLLHPESKGEITLNSASAIDFPNINPNYLKEPIDIERLYLAVQKTLRLLETKAFKNIGAKLDDMVLEGCEGGPNDKAFWYCFIRHLTQGFYHPIGTCRMGDSAADSVVDYNLRVHGLRNLRVVDVSVIRRTTSGHLNSVAVMIGEKMAASIT